MYRLFARSSFQRRKAGFHRREAVIFAFSEGSRAGLDFVPSRPILLPVWSVFPPIIPSSSLLFQNIISLSFVTRIYSRNSFEFVFRRTLIRELGVIESLISSSLTWIQLSPEPGIIITFESLVRPCHLARLQINTTNHNRNFGLNAPSPRAVELESQFRFLLRWTFWKEGDFYFS